jgi:serine/threonine protein kinase
MTQVKDRRTLADADVLIGQRYEVGPMIRDGTFATVYRAFDRHLRKDVAIKIASSFLNQMLLFQEYTLLRDLVGKVGIVQAHDQACFRAGPRSYLYIAETLLHEQNLEEVLATRHLDDSEVLGFLAESLRVLSTLHHQGIVHKDMRTRNIGLPTLQDSHSLLEVDLRRPVLIDFGLSLRLPPEEGWHPESLGNGVWVRRRDLYGLGRMLDREIVPPTSRLRQHPGFVELLSSLVEDDPRKRPSSPAAVRKTLRHLVADAGL